MRGSLVKIASKVVGFVPFSRKAGALLLTVYKKMSDQKAPSFYTQFRQQEAQLQRMRDYQVWLHKNLLTFKVLEAQKEKAKQLPYRPKISILVPTYNTNIKHLEACIQSVIAQTYFNWELCIADDASPNKEVATLIQKYADSDERIKFIQRETNGHICAATNSALEVADGEFVSLLDHDDILWTNALFEVVKTLNDNQNLDVIYTDEDKLEEDGYTHTDPFFKPDWSPDYLRTINYITHFATLRRSLVNKIDGFRIGTHGAQDWDLFLRATEATTPEKIHHIPKVVYSWRKSPDSTAMAPESKDYAYINQKKVLKDDLKNRGLKGKVVQTQYQGYWRVKYAISKKPKVSIVIPTKDNYKYIANAVDSIIEQTTYKNYEVVIVDTGSTDKKVWDYYEKLKEAHKNIHITEWGRDKFNFAGVCNFGAQKAKGSYLVFLNNDTKVVAPHWLEAMLEHAQRENTGAVGVKLLFADETIQHGGIVLGMGSDKSIRSVAGHIFTEWADESTDHLKALFTDSIRNYSAVTAACMMVKKSVFDEVNGFDEEFEIAFNDVDLCLRIQEKGYFNVYTPHAMLYHYESKSVGKFRTKQRNDEQFEKETELMANRWGWELIENDPYYNPNLSLASPYGMLRNDD